MLYLIESCDKGKLYDMLIFSDIYIPGVRENGQTEGHRRRHHEDCIENRQHYQNFSAISSIKILQPTVVCISPEGHLHLEIIVLQYADGC